MAARIITRRVRRIILPHLQDKVQLRKFKLREKLQMVAVNPQLAPTNGTKYEETIIKKVNTSFTRGKSDF